MSDDHEAIVVTANEITTEGSDQLHPMVALFKPILQNNPSPETLRDLMEIQKGWERDEARRRYTAAMTELKRDLPAYIDRDKKVAFGTTKYNYSSLAHVIDVVLEHMSQHGFSHAWFPRTTEDRGTKVTVTCRITHRDGHFEEAVLSSPPDNSGKKGPAQAIASTITLLQRYTLLAMLGIATADMPEPHGPAGDESNPDQVDPGLNLKAAAHIRGKLGGILEAEEWVGKSVKDWSAKDLADLREWLPKRLTEGDPK